MTAAHRCDVLRAEAHSINLYVHWHTAGPEYRFTTGVGDFAANTGEVVFTAANLRDAEAWLRGARTGYAHCERETALNAEDRA